MLLVSPLLTFFGNYHISAKINHIDIKIIIFNIGHHKDIDE